MSKEGIKADTIIRTIVLAIALINQILAFAGKDTIPITEDEVYQGVTLVFTAGAAVWAWWKNNSFTGPAIAADAYMHQLKDTLKG